MILYNIPVAICAGLIGVTSGFCAFLYTWRHAVKFSELIRLFEKHGFRIVKEPISLVTGRYGVVV